MLWPKKKKEKRKKKDKFANDLESNDTSLCSVCYALQRKVKQAAT
jgi:hypothetical protein